MPTAVDDLRTMAICRLMLDKFDHVKAYWITLSIGTAQTALSNENVAVGLAKSVVTLPDLSDFLNRRHRSDTSGWTFGLLGVFGKR